MHSPEAPGAPGIEPRWSSSAKDGVGTSYHTACRLWFTLSQGIISELYCPTVDTPNTRGLKFLISDGATFCHDERVDLRHEVEIKERGSLLYELTNTERHGRYRLTKQVLTDPHTSVLLMQTRLEIMDESLRGKLRIYALLWPHLGGHGAGNKGARLDIGERTLLHAEREDFHLVLGCDRGFCKRSVGYEGVSDGAEDLRNFQMDWEYPHAGPGTLALTGEIPLSGAGGEGGHGAEFLIGVAFADSAVSATAKLLQSVATPFEQHRRTYVAQWQRAAVDAGEEKSLAVHTGDEGSILRVSHRVLLAHEDKNFQGAMVASLSTPWGETKSDVDEGGYHLVWTRDLVQSASGLLATGEIGTPVRALLWLTCIQKADGSFPQNSWIDGEPYWQGIQVDEMAAPLLLGWRIWRQSPEEFDRAGFRPVLRRACAYLMTAGPVTSQDRWEESAGYSPSTIAMVLAALCAAADLATNHGSPELAQFVIEYADWINSHVEAWCVTNRGEVLPGKPRHYIRITPADPLAPDPHPDPDTLDLALANGGGVHPARNIVSGDFLHLVRLGLRAADDPVIHDSVEVYDSALKRDLPGGPCWRRYPHDGYGQKPDGAAFDGTGEGRCWPILTGERGHYEVAAGRDPMPYVRAMEAFSNETGMLPEQVWDEDDIPERHQLRGRPSGSAMPLCWTHAEYISLVRSRRDGRVFDRIEPAFQRYVVEGRRDSAFEMWTFRHRTRRIPAGRILRLILEAPAKVRWTFDGWSSAVEGETGTIGFASMQYVDIPTRKLAPGARVEWTFFWPEADRWEDANFCAEVV